MGFNSGFKGLNLFWTYLIFVHICNSRPTHLYKKIDIKITGASWVQTAAEAADIRMNPCNTSTGLVTFKYRSQYLESTSIFFLPALFRIIFGLDLWLLDSLSSKVFWTIEQARKYSYLKYAHTDCTHTLCTNLWKMQSKSEPIVGVRD